MTDFATIFPISLEGASLECLDVDRNNATTRIRLVIVGDDGEVVCTREEELRLFQKDFKNPAAARRRVLANARRFEVSSVTPGDLFATYPAFKPLKRGLSTAKLMKSIRKPAEAGTGGFYGALGATRWWPTEAKTALHRSRLFIHLEYTSLPGFVGEVEAEEVAAARSALDEAGCTGLLAALDAAVAGSTPPADFKLLDALEQEVRPALEAWVEAHAPVLLASS